MSLLVIILFLIFPSLHAADNLCRGVVLHGKSIKLDETEKRLVCGDKKVEAYKNIPEYEASYFMKGFLQSRGFLNPRFEKKDDELHVHVGKRYSVKKIMVESERPKVSRKVERELIRLYKRRLLNTQMLNSIEAEAKGQLRKRGYACATVTSEVQVEDETILIRMQRLTSFNFGPVKKEVINGLEPQALDRFYAFDADKKFNEELLRLTEKRMVRSDVVQGTYFLESCSEDVKTFGLEQAFITGQPRTLRFGAGASTEQGPMARVRWSNNRYKSMASQLSANLQGSLRSQSLTLTADSFFWKNQPRRSLYSQLELIRESQFEYEQSILRLRPHMKWTRDAGDHFQTYTIGPSYETGTYHASNNPDTKTFSTGLIEGSLSFMRHDYELYDIHPQEGDHLTLNFDYRHPAFGFEDQLLKLESDVVKLSRLMNMGRGTLVGGARFEAGTTWVNDDVSLNSLPPAVKFFGGGSDDIRGFLLQTLPKNDGLGALSKVGLKLELRRTYLWKESLEGFVFYDQAYFGDRAWQLDSKLWYAPGVGLRWLSPIGMVQGYVAQGMSSKPFENHGPFYFIGLGGTF